MLGSTVFLEGGRTLSMTQDTDGVKLLSVESPWSIRVSHKGKEYVVPIGQRPNEGIFRPLGSASLPSGITVVRDDAAAAPTGPGAATAAGTAGALGSATAPSPVTRPAVDPPSPPSPTGPAPSEPAPPEAEPPSSEPAAAGDDPATEAPQAAVPMPLNRATVSRMDMPTAREALAAIAAARARTDLDDALRNRLETEEQWVVDRIAQLGG
jgi:hypothetical protein